MTVLRLMFALMQNVHDMNDQLLDQNSEIVEKVLYCDPTHNKTVIFKGHEQCLADFGEQALIRCFPLIRCSFLFCHSNRLTESMSAFAFRLIRIGAGARYCRRPDSHSSRLREPAFGTKC